MGSSGSFDTDAPGELRELFDGAEGKAGDLEGGAGAFDQPEELFGKAFDYLGMLALHGSPQWLGKKERQTVIETGIFAILHLMAIIPESATGGDVAAQDIHPLRRAIVGI